MILNVEFQTIQSHCSERRLATALESNYLLLKSLEVYHSLYMSQISSMNLFPFKQNTNEPNN